MAQTTAQRLVAIMEERNLRQVDILEKAKPYCEKYKQKLTKSDLSQFVNGKVTPRQWKLTILSLALDVSEAWLMGFDVPMERVEEPIEFKNNRVGALNKVEEELVLNFRQLTQQGKEYVLQSMDLAKNMYSSGDNSISKMEDAV